MCLWWVTTCFPPDPSVPMDMSVTAGLSSRLEVDYKEPKFQDPQKAKQAERLGMGLGRVR